MFRVFPQDLKEGDTIVWDSIEACVLSLKNMEKSIEVNVRETESGSVNNWVLSKSELLNLVSSEEERELYEPTIPDLNEVTEATVPAFRTPENVFDMDESDTNPFGEIKTIPRAPKVRELK